MKIALQISSWVAVALGVLAILGSAEGGVDAGYSFVGGVFFLTQGVLALVYISQKENK